MPPTAMTLQNSLRALALTGIFAVLLTACSKPVMAESNTPPPPADKPLAYATYGGGCFWCVEAVFERIDGVVSVTSGYAGGHVDDPSYKDVTTGETGHAEVVQLAFDPAKVSYETLLEVFWLAHDPTTLNRQGADVGTQYRSIILYHDEAQKTEAEASRMEAQKHFDNPIVTEIVPLDHFYTAEEYHQNFFAENPNQPYCSYVIAPKIRKLTKYIEEINARQ